MMLWLANIDTDDNSDESRINYAAVEKRATGLSYFEDKRTRYNFGALANGIGR